jgi:hypothetical protein
MAVTILHSSQTNRITFQSLVQFWSVTTVNAATFKSLRGSIQSCFMPSSYNFIRYLKSLLGPIYLLDGSLPLLILDGRTLTGIIPSMLKWVASAARKNKHSSVIRIRLFNTKDVQSTHTFSESLQPLFSARLAA